METDVFLKLWSIIILGVGAQWLAWRLKFPPIVFLLILGFMAGPATQFLNPNELLGELLFPFVSLSVAIILFEGGLGLRINELRGIGRAMTNLITIGVLINWLVITVAARLILNFSFEISLLLGSILIVTGPTVIGPLLRHMKPLGRVGNIVKWEGIVIDPIGALLAVMVFEYILIGEFQKFYTFVLFLKIISVGVFFGVAGAWFLVFLLRRYWVPDFLHGVFTLMVVLGAFGISNATQAELGLFTAVFMGITLANQNRVSVRHIGAFKENLSILMISILFILLGANLQFTDLTENLEIKMALFLIMLIVVARPISVMISTLGLGIRWSERIFISLMAPRGIVAAAISSIFALRLAEHNIPQTEYLVPVTFMVIIATVTFYGLTAPVVARRLGLAQANPQG